MFTFEEKKKKTEGRVKEREVYHMYSAITFSVVSERSRLMRSESSDIVPVTLNTQQTVKERLEMGLYLAVYTDVHRGGCCSFYSEVSMWIQNIRGI